MVFFNLARKNMPTSIGQCERQTQNRIIKLFQQVLRYEYLGNWHERTNNQAIEPALLAAWLKKRGISHDLAKRIQDKLQQAAKVGGSRLLYDANKEVYSLLRYGVKVKEEQGEQHQTVWLIDWQNPQHNHFALAEEVSIVGENTKRPDLVLYVNGIALVVIELKRASVSVAEGIRQQLDNQKKSFIRSFYTTAQLLLAGNDSEGLRYGTVETPEKHYYRWKEAGNTASLDDDLATLCQPARLLELIHDFIVFDFGRKKTCRHNQYFGIRAAQQKLLQHQGGIIWHTQGSGKSLTMVWLAKWLRENVADARVLIVTDRTELDEQIEGVFLGVDEKITRCKSGRELITTLNQAKPWLLCSLIHKFGVVTDDDNGTDDFIAELTRSIPADFCAKGKLFVFVDECHRTQSGKLHQAMKRIVPQAVLVGFTGTPLLNTDKQKSIEVFGGFIHTYKFDEAVADKVVLDLRYEARDINQYVSSQNKVDEWFELKTKGLSDMARARLKLKWGTMQKLLSSQDRLSQIVSDILMDMEKRPRLVDGRGNAMLVCASVYQACKVYELFEQTELKGKCAIITSYRPSPADIKGQDSGEGLTEKLHQYAIYRRMLADFFEQSEDEAMAKTEEFETKVKERFIEQPAQMRLLIVVDKLLTGFDAPSATYLYIDKSMRDHGLFQAICRVNRLDGDDKEYGYIIDYKDLFHRLEGAIGDYTSGAFDAYDAEDVAGLLSDRLARARERLEQCREWVKGICETVMQPRAQADYFRYFCGESHQPETLKATEQRRLALYQAVAALVRAYANLANEFDAAGYSQQDFQTIKQEVEFYSQLNTEIKMHSGDYVDMKLYEPAMRYLLDNYLRAEDSEKVIEFEELGLVELIVKRGLAALDHLPEGLRQNETATAETIENNMRRVIMIEHVTNPAYFEKMSTLLNALIEQRRQQAIDYKAYLEQVKQLAEQLRNSNTSQAYPSNVKTNGQKALYDNLQQNEALVLSIDSAIKRTKKADWVGNKMKENEVKAVLYPLLQDETVLHKVMELVKNQGEYR